MSETFVNRIVSICAKFHENEQIILFSIISDQFLGTTFSQTLFIIFSIESQNERKSYENQILEFGQTPKQLFTKAHPKKMVY